MRSSALLLVLALPLAAFAEDQKLTLLFTGDNGGEVSPCG